MLLSDFFFFLQAFSQKYTFFELSLKLWVSNATFQLKTFRRCHRSFFLHLCLVDSLLENTLLWRCQWLFGRGSFFPECQWGHIVILQVAVAVRVLMILARLLVGEWGGLYRIVCYDFHGSQLLHARIEVYLSLLVEELAVIGEILSGRLSGRLSCLQMRWDL